MQLNLSPHNHGNQQTTLENLHAESKHWLSELNFYKHELSFFTLLGMRLYRDPFGNEKANKASRIKQHLTTLMKDVDLLFKRTSSYLQRIEQAIQSKSMLLRDNVHNDHVNQENDLLMLESDVQQFKLAMYRDAEQMLKKEKAHQQLHTL